MKNLFSSFGYDREYASLRKSINDTVSNYLKSEGFTKSAVKQSVDEIIQSFKEEADKKLQTLDRQADKKIESVVNKKLDTAFSNFIRNNITGG